MRIAVVGASGQLGAAIVRGCSIAHEVTSFRHADLDVLDERAVAEAMERTRPDVIVNCVAYNEVDAAEVQPILALDVNAFAVRLLARAAAAHNAALVHYSTDFVFDGMTSRPYVENDQPNPQSVYAASKLIGEWFAADTPRGYVLRVESLFGRAPGGRPAKGSAEAILAAIRAGREARVFVDRTVSPTYVIDAARATRQLLESGAPSGLYHCVNSGQCSWFEFARAAAEILGVEGRLLPVKMADVDLRARRPKYCALSNEKLRSVGVTMPTWQDALADYLRGEVAHEVADRQT